MKNEEKIILITERVISSQKSFNLGKKTLRLKIQVSCLEAILNSHDNFHNHAIFDPIYVLVSNDYEGRLVIRDRPKRLSCFCIVA